MLTKFQHRIVVLLALVVLPWVSVAHATLLGDTVSGELDFPTLGSFLASCGSGTVSPTATLNCNEMSLAVSASQITLTFATFGFRASAFNGPVITDLTSSNIAGVSVDAATTLPGFSAADLSFSSNSVDINLAGLVTSEAQQSDKVVIDLAFQGTSAVPEPGSLMLLGSALLGFGIIRRRLRV